MRRACAAFLLWLALSSIALADPTAELRLAWGGGTRRQWQGTVSVDRGAVQIVRLLNDDADAPGSIWHENGAIKIRQPTARAVDGFDFQVTAPLDALIRIEMRDPTSPEATAVTHEIPLRDAIAQPVNRELDKANNRILLRRPAYDLLHVTPRRGHLVFSPGEPLTFDVEPRLLPVGAGSSLQVRARLVSTANGQELQTQEQPIKTTAEGATPAKLSWEMALPQAEGVYDVVIEAVEQGLLRWPKTRQVAQRRLQVVVIDDRAQSSPLEGPGVWNRVMEIDPTSSTWYERFRAWPLFPGLRRGPLGNGGMQIKPHATLGPTAQLSPHKPDQEPFWEAYPLTVGNPGEPHILEVEYPSDALQTLGISVVEPNAAGIVTPINLDSGVFTANTPTGGETPTWQRHRLIFWPRTNAPMVLLSNRGDGQVASYGKIRVLSGPAKLPRRFLPGDLPERLLAGYMRQPLLSENFGATETLDLASGRSLDDWRTIHQGATRLSEYLQHVGYNGQMLTVLSDGSTIYPSRHLTATQQHENGELFESGQDPMRKDALELTLRVFDRDGLKLIPSLRFNSPLPELEERIRRGGPDAEGIRLIGPRGLDYASHYRMSPGAAPYYNPLNPHVQEAMLAMVREVVQRYGNHPSFAGIAIELSADSCTQLPGEAWGLDDATISQFQQATGLQPPGAGPSRFAERAYFLAPSPRPRFTATSEASMQWLQWRAQVLAEFYRTMQREVTAVRRDAMLYLGATTLFDSKDAREWLRPTLPPKARSDEVMLSLGLRDDLLRQDGGIVFLRPYRVLPPGPVADQGIDSELNRAGDLDAAFNRMPTTGSLLFHPSQRTRLTSFDDRSPYGKAKSAMSLHSQFSPAGHRNRERFVHALATLDADAIFDGGAMLSLGQEDSMTDLVAAYRRLPAGKFDLLTNKTQPVVIRTKTLASGTYAYLANDCPWPMTVELQIDAPPGCLIDELSGRRRLPAFNPAQWQIRLEPYDLIAVRFRSPHVRITGARTLPNPELQAHLVRQNRDFQQRVEMLVNPPPIGIPDNAHFEQPTNGGKIPGWTLLNPNSGEISLTPEGEKPAEKPAGNQAIRFRSTGPLASLRTEPFAPPPSRRVRIKMWLRVENVEQQPSLQFVVEDGKQYRRYANVGNGGFKIEDRWMHFEYAVVDLPLDGDTELQFGFDMKGPGTVYIDDVQIFDLHYEREELIYLSNIGLANDYQLRDNKLGECLTNLGGYWPRFINSNVPLPTGVARQPLPGPAAPPADDDKAASRPTKPLERWFKR